MLFSDKKNNLELEILFFKFLFGSRIMLRTVNDAF